MMDDLIETVNTYQKEGPVSLEHSLETGTKIPILLLYKLDADQYDITACSQILTSAEMVLNEELRRYGNENIYLKVVESLRLSTLDERRARLSLSQVKRDFRLKECINAIGVYFTRTDSKGLYRRGDLISLGTCAEGIVIFDLDYENPTRVLAHELGHALCLSDNDIKGNLMQQVGTGRNIDRSQYSTIWRVLQDLKDRQY